MSDDILQSFIDELCAYGTPPAHPSEIKADDKWHDIDLAGDPPKSKKGFYRLKIENNFGVGNYGHRSWGDTQKFTSKANRKFTPEERKVWEEQREIAKKAQEEQQTKEWNDISKQALAVWDKSTPAAIHPYGTRKKIKLYSARINDDNLVIPMYADSRLFMIQIITPAGDKLFSWKREDGSWVEGGRKKGCFCPMTDAAEDKSVIVITTGYATGATIREATGFPVVVAFDDSNLIYVAKAIRLKYPDAKILIASDNDQWTLLGKYRDKIPEGIEPKKLPGNDPLWKEWREKGWLANSGVTSGQNAAREINGFNIEPEFPDDDPEKRTDYNDLAVSESLGAVKDRIQLVLAPPLHAPVLVEKAPISVSDPTPPAPENDSQADGGEYYEPDYDSMYGVGEDESHMLSGDFGLPFRVLGYDGGTFYYFPFKQRQIISLTAGAHSINNLLQLASLSQWQSFFSSENGNQTAIGQIATLATNALMRRAEERGVFNEADRVRGCGAWSDAGRAILHCGDVIYVDGVPTDPKAVSSRYVYIAAQKIFTPGEVALSSAEARKLRDICESCSWENKLSGSLLAGWLVIAPICSMLEWRPHIWLTGQAESGKTTVMNKIIKAALGPIAHSVDGGTSEPAIRAGLGYDGRPLIYDEAEAESNAQRTTMQGVLSLARKASSGQVVVKFGQPSFKAQFCACFSAINPPVKDFADETRIVMMVLKKNRGSKSEEEYKKLLKKIEILTPEYHEALLTRIINNMGSLLTNIKVFRAAGRTVFDAARLSDQMAPMLAGLYLLSNTGVITEEKAEAWLREQDWTFHTAVNDEPDPVRLVHRIATSIIRAAPPGLSARDYSIGELILTAAGLEPGASPAEVRFADNTLRRYSIVSRRDGVVVGNKNNNLENILKDTPWTSWARTLSDVAGSTKTPSSIYFAPGDKQRGVKLPMDMFYEGEAQLELYVENKNREDEEEEVKF